EEVEAEETVEEKKSPIVKIILIVVGVLALAGGGYFAYTNFFQEKAVEAPAEGGKPAEGEVEEEAADLGVMFSLNPFIVNLADSGGKRFLKVTIALELSTQEVHAELKENLHKITDSILVLLSSKTFEDVYSVQGKFKLKDEIATRVNRFLIVGHVKDAYFTEFVIQ
ncbi:MAG: flagellar basal body-associated FliL family protein, partial [Nitrospinae bacterium]|nr:flagellar basal body-associated FliL family protein [Nitrospinota bacterium]